jgi:CHAT domain-containing protein
MAVGRRPGILPTDAHEAIRRGQAREALDRYAHAAVELEGRGEWIEAASAHVVVLILARHLGRYQEAIGAGRRALALLEQQPDTDQVMRRRLTAYSNLGACFGDLGDSDQARRYWEDGLALSRGLPIESVRLQFIGVFSQHLAVVARLSGDQTLALRYGTEAVAALERSVDQLPASHNFDRHRANGRRLLGSSLFQVGEARLALGQLDEAEAAFRQAARVMRLVGPDPAGVAALVGLGRVALARRDYAGAERAFRDARALAQRLNSVPQLMAVDLNTAQALAAQGRQAEALAAYRRAVDLAEDVRAELQQSELRSGFLENKQAMYQGAVRAALALGDVGDAFAFAERARARAFLDLLGNQSLSKGKTRALLDEESRLRAQLAEARALPQGASDDPEEAEAPDAERIQQQMEAAERAYRVFLARIRAKSQEQASLMTVDPVSLREVQGLLRTGTTLLEYLVGGSETILWVIDGERAEVVRVPVTRAELVGRVRAFRQAIGERASPDRVNRLAEELEALLIRRARQYIRTERVLVVPHDVLHYLPFAALRSPEGHWLVEDYALATLPSASVLRFLGEKREGAARGVLAVGNPELGSGAGLRFAEREARVVAARYPGATVLVGEAATESAAKKLSGEAGLIHFASHGELNEADPLRSALLLTPDRTEDGRLEVREVLGLELHARLVVLSACETGLGKLSRGDELVGLQRAFLYAGTPAVVTTLWKVDDRASYELMREFYARVETEGAGEALRGAQRAVMGEFTHPYAWAAFGLTGVPW